MKPTVAVLAPFRSVSGYGKKAIDFCYSLLRIRGEEWDIRFHETTWLSGGKTELPADDPILARMVGEGVTTFDTAINLVIYIGLPTEIFLRGEMNIVLTSGTETTTAPPAWIQAVNEKWSGVIVPSEFIKSQFEKYVTQPVEVVCEGVDFRWYSPTKPFLLSQIKELFCFLFVGMWLPGQYGEDRKNVAKLIEQFLITFAKRPMPPALLIKTNMGRDDLFDQRDVMAHIKEIRDIVAERLGTTNLPPVYLLHGEISDAEMAGLYTNSKVKAMVSLTKGEAVGRPLLEFAAGGKPVITTAFSAPPEYLGEAHVLLPYRLQQVHSSAVQGNVLTTQQQWARIDDASVRAALKSMYDNYPRYLDRSKKAAKRIQTHYGNEAMDRQLDQALRNLVPTDFLLNLPTD